MTTSIERSLLSGLRVAEVGSFVAVPYAGRLLHLMGAIVYKVGGSDDPARTIGRAGGPSLYDCLNDGKRPVASLGDVGAPDLVLADARDLRGATDAPLTMTLRVLPIESPPVADSVLLSALAAASWAMGEPGRPPLPMPAESAAFAVGAVFAGAAAVRLAAGDTGAFEIDGLLGLASFVEQNSTSYRLSGIGWRREGRRAAGSAGIYPYGIYSCRDGQVALIARSRKDWTLIATALGAESVLDRFPDPFDIAVAHADEADELLEPFIARLTKQEVLQRAESDGVLAVPVATLDDVRAYENLVTERDFWDQIDTTQFPGLPFLAIG